MNKATQQIMFSSKTDFDTSSGVYDLSEVKDNGRS